MMYGLFTQQVKRKMLAGFALLTICFVIAGSSSFVKAQGSVPDFVPPNPQDNAFPMWYRAELLPKRFDWRDYGSVGNVENRLQASITDPSYRDSNVTTPKDQSSCGSCYAFGTLGSVEASLARKGFGTFDLSENNAKNCNQVQLDKQSQCGDGGNFPMVADLLNKKGTVQETDDPYDASSSPATCKSNISYQQTLLGWLQIGKNDEYTDNTTLKNALINYGAIEISVKADNKGATGQRFKEYDGKTPIYMPLTKQDGTDHSVLLVGWDDTITHEGGKGVWIIKNSWGTSWGKGGYGEIAYGSANLGLGWVYVPTDWQRYNSNETLLSYDKYGRGSLFYTSGLGKYGMVKFTPTADSCANRVEFQLFAQTSNINVTIYDDVQTQTNSWGEQVLVPVNPLATIKDKAWVSGGNVSLSLDSPLRLKQNDDVYIAVMLAQDNLAADASTSGTERSYMSYDGQNWQISNYTLNIRLRVGTCGATIPVQPTATPTPFVPTATPTPLPTATPTPTPKPAEPTKIPTTVPTVNPICQVPGQGVLTTTRDENADQPLPLQPEPFRYQRFASPKSHQRQPSQHSSQALNTSKPLIASSSTSALTFTTGLFTERKEPNLKGVVKLPSNQPAVKASIAVYPLDQQGLRYPLLDEMVTEDDGSFETDLPDGKYQLVIQPPMYQFDPYNSTPLNGVESLDYTATVTSATNLGNLLLPAATKRIKGSIKDDAGKPVTEAYVMAYNAQSGQLVQAIPQSDGTFDIAVGGGTWDIEAEGTKNSTLWFVGESVQVLFAKDKTPETKSGVDLVMRKADLSVSGQIVAPDGSPIPSLDTDVYAPGEYAIDVTAWDSETGRGITRKIDSTGAFTLPLLAGVYEIEIWVDDQIHPQYTAPIVDSLDVDKSTTIGKIRLLANSARISGKVTTVEGNPAAGIYVDAWRDDGLWVYGSTDVSGTYQIALPPGTWELAPYVPDTYSTLFTGLPQKVTIAAQQTGSANFTLEPSVGYLYGVVLDETKKRLQDIEALAYVRRNDNPNPVNVEFVEQGIFRMKVPYGELKVGLYLGPGSEYSFINEVVPSLTNQPTSTKAAAIAALSAHEQSFTMLNAENKTVSIPLKKNDAHITGKLVDSQTGKAVSGISGDILASPQGNNAVWQWSEIDPETGEFDIPVFAGDWNLSYELVTDQYVQAPIEIITATVQSGKTTNQDLALRPLNGVVSGQVVDESGKPVSNAPVWIRGGKYEGYTRSDTQGNFTIYTTRKVTSELTLLQTTSTDQTRIGTLLKPCTNTNVTSCKTDAEPQNVTPGERSSTGASMQQVQQVRLVTRGTDTFLVGQVVNSMQQHAPVSGAQVSGYNAIGGQSIQTTTDNNGCFFANVTKTDTYQWTIRSDYQFTQDGADLITTDSTTLSGNNYQTTKTTMQSTNGGTVQSLGATLILQYSGVLPPPFNQTFPVDQGWSGTLVDGTTIQIPANAIATNQQQVRILIQPTVYVPETYLYRPVGYGYTITIFDSNGKAITSPFKRDVLVTLRYTDEQLAHKGVAESTLQPGRVVESSYRPEEQYLLDTTAKKVDIQVKQTGTYALLSPNTTTSLQITNAMVYLPVITR